jgi:hypothetical protein
LQVKKGGMGVGVDKMGNGTEGGKRERGVKKEQE